jgi:hypothetical protein
MVRGRLISIVVGSTLAFVPLSSTPTQAATKRASTASLQGFRTGMYLTLKTRTSQVMSGKWVAWGNHAGTIQSKSSAARQWISFIRVHQNARGVARVTFYAPEVSVYRVVFPATPTVRRAISNTLRS